MDTIVTKCNLCAATFGETGVPIIGEKPEAKALRITQEVFQHLVAAHEPLLREILIATDHYQALLVLQQFTLTDATLIEAMETARKFAAEQLAKGALA